MFYEYILTSIFIFLSNFIVVYQSYASPINTFCAVNNTDFFVNFKSKDSFPKTAFSFLLYNRQTSLADLKLIDDIHKCLNIKLILPMCIFTTLTVQINLKYFLVLNWTQNVDEGQARSSLAQYPLGSSLPFSAKPTRQCLRIPLEYFRGFKSITLEQLLRERKNIFFDHFSNSNIDKLTSRHQLVLKVLIESLNLSLTCVPNKMESIPTVSLPKEDITFLVLDLHVDSANNGRELFDPREVYIIKFASTYKTSHRSLIYNMVRPIGWRVFLSIIILLPLVTVLLIITSRISDIHPPSAADIFSVVYRPIFDQCEESYFKSPSTRIHFRLILITWLYYCLIVTETYRSELISYTTNPIVKYWYSEFDEILSNSSIQSPVILLGSRPGQEFYFTSILVSEIYYSFTEKRRQKYSTLLNWVRKFSTEYKLNKRNKTDDMRTGKAVIIGQDFTVHSFSEACKVRLGKWFYKPSRDSFSSFVFWAINEGPFQEQISTVLKNLRDGGILDYFRHQQDVTDIARFARRVHILFHEDLPLELDEDFRPTYESLKFLHIKAITFLLLVGLGTSAITMIFENCFYRSCCSGRSHVREMRRIAVYIDQI